MLDRLAINPCQVTARSSVRRTSSATRNSTSPINAGSAARSRDVMGSAGRLIFDPCHGVQELPVEVVEVVAEAMVRGVHDPEMLGLASGAEHALDVGNRHELIV